MSDKDAREAFRLWFQSNGNKYLPEACWKAWQAATAHSEAQSKQRIAELEASLESEVHASMVLRQQLTESQRQLGEATSHNNFDATRLRRLATFCGVAVPESAEELLQVAGVVIGSCLRNLQNPTASQLSAEQYKMVIQAEALEKAANQLQDDELAHANGSYLLARLRRISSELRSHCMCAACKDGVIHSSDCSVHNMPSYPNGNCDCELRSQPSKEQDG